MMWPLLPLGIKWLYFELNYQVKGPEGSEGDDTMVVSADRKKIKTKQIQQHNPNFWEPVQEKVLVSWNRQVESKPSCISVHISNLFMYVTHFVLLSLVGSICCWNLFDPNT